MTLRGVGDKLILGKNGGLVDGASECCCCKCCATFCGDEMAHNNYENGTKLLQMDSGIYVVINESTSTIVTGPDAGNFCELKFNLDLTIVDPLGHCIDGSGEFPPVQGGECDTTGELTLICDCVQCSDGIVWELRITECDGETCEIPAVIYMGGDCKLGDCDNPSCSDCSALSTPGGDTISGGSFVINDPDGSVRCQCPGDYCDEGEEI